MSVVTDVVLLPVEDVDLRGVAPLDVAARAAAARQRDLDRAADPGPYRFAEPLSTRFTLADSGTWEELPGEGRLWRLRVRSARALSLSLGFSLFQIPAGARLWIYDPQRRDVHGPYTREHRSRRGRLWTPIVRGEELVVELFVPRDAEESPALEIGSTNVGFRSITTVVPEMAGSCNNDVVCPEGDPWRRQIRSVARYSIAGSGLCSGQLLNNTGRDHRPYFLSARHCGVTPDNDDTLVFYWNYESPHCGDQSGGSLGDNQSGAVYRASYSASDFLLVELSQRPDPDSRVYYTGWDASGRKPLSAVGIHHPGGEEKSISFERDPLTSTAWLSNTANSSANHWRLADWDDGTTESGSSGSCLWDPASGLCVGQLHGGWTACGVDLPAWYGKLSASWNGGGTKATRLRDWLDPGATGALAVGGLESPEPCTSLSISPERVIVGEAAGSAEVHITGSPSGCAGGWTASESLSWLSVSPGSGFAPGSTTVSWESQSASSVRTGNATIAGHSFEVIQGPDPEPPCISFSLSPTTLVAGDLPIGQEVAVNGFPAGCVGGSWTASGNGSWITVAPVSGEGTGATTVSLAQNLSSFPRSDDAVIAGHAFPVLQAAAPDPGDIQLFSGVTEEGVLTSDVPRAGWQHYYVDVPRRVEHLTVALEGPSDDVDLYVKGGTRPGLTSYDCRSTNPGVAPESCVLPGPDPGRWWIGVNNSATGTITYRITATAQPVRHDLDGDGESDILWHHQVSGHLYAWLLEGSVAAAGSYLTPDRLADTQWQIRAICDFDGDLTNDILWHHQKTGDLYVWFMDRLAVASGDYLTPSRFADTRWQIRGVGDFDGDGRNDILWHHQSTGHLYVWHLDGAVAVSGSYLTPSRFADTRWQIRGVADFDSDGDSDILWRHEGTGELYVWFLDGTVTATGSYLTPSRFADTRWKIVQVSDFDGDGQSDLLWHHQETGDLYVWFLDGTVTTTGSYLTPDRFSDTRWKVVPR